MISKDFSMIGRGGDLEDCDLSGFTLRNAELEGTFLLDANFTGADLEGTVFYLVFGMRAIFDNASLRSVSFLGGSFNDASFANADMTNASFLADNMGGEVNLCGADFSLAILDGTTFESVLYDETTKFPVGFSPKKI